jgi:Holliday junction DNA helicase RuvA
MIGRIRGVLLAKNPPGVLIDVGGLAYEVDVPMSTFYVLPATGETTTLLTHHLVREDAQLLYGFATDEERTAFRELLKISGIGARTALAVLSGLSVAELVAVVALQETARLVRVPGIGKKTAERLLLELKGKLTSMHPATEAAAPAPGRHRSDVVQALFALGYNEKEALAAVRELPEGLPIADGIRRALKILAKP